MTSIHRLLLAAAAAALTACSSGLANLETDDTGDDPGGPGAAEIGLGLDPGVALSSPIDPGVALAGARIPTDDPDVVRDVVFVAFATAAAADDADGAGTPLVRDAAAPADANGELDVFLVALEDELVDTGEATAPQPAAFSRALVNTFRHSRCVHCHGVGHVTPEGEEEVFPVAHPGPAPVIETEECVTCHTAANVPDLANVEWRAPLDDNGDFDFRGKTVEELNQMAQSFDVDEHLRTDTRIRWAIVSGNVPFQASVPGGNAGTSEQWQGAGRDVGAVPISYATFLAQVDAWVEGGFQATAAGAVRDVLLVSQAAGGAAAGDGASLSPAITYVPNPDFTPGSGERVGTVHVAFASDATDLTADGGSTRDVFRASVAVFADRDPATGAAQDGGLDLAFDTGSTTLVSVAAGGGAGGNGASDRPAIDASGSLVAFETAATDLVAGFNDGDAAGRDVFLRDLDAGTTHLVSASSAAVNQGASGDSSNPAISPTGGFVAFESTGSDLVADDTNGVQDVFTARLEGGAVGAATRASLTAAGTEGTGGDSGNASVFFDGTTLSVAFESTKTDLVDGATDGTSHVYLREGTTTELLSQRRTGAEGTPGNGDSRAPRLSPTGLCVLFETDADNLDALQSADANGATDVLLVDLAGLRSTGDVLGRRVSLASSREDGDGPASAPRIAALRDRTGAFTDGLALFRTAAENLGATGSDVVTVRLSGEGVVPVTDFIASPLVGPAPLEVQFTSLATGGPTAFAWSFDPDDPAAVSDLEDPAFTYSTPGTYTVSLTVTREDGEETATKADLIRVLEPIQASFDVTPAASGVAPFAVTFTDTSTGDLEGATYAWDFGDGATSPEPSPAHTFVDPGTYDVSLTVSGAAGTDTATTTITANLATGANFTVDDASGFADHAVQFTNTSVGSPTTFAWDFGDGSEPSAEESPAHTYTAPGTYTVTLSVDGPGGRSSETKVGFIEVKSFADDIVPLFAAYSCLACHGTSGGLALDGTPAEIHLELLGPSGTGAPVEGASCTAEGLLRVEPFDAANSQLKQVVDPGVTACNDAFGMGTFDAADLQLLVDWIEDGAKD